MVELKTLKDIMPASEFHRNKFSVREGYAELVEKKDLRAEAIHWVKKFRKENHEDLGELYDLFGMDFVDSGYGEYANERYETVISWIMKFFGLTEEDLK